jgi:hypothetical protein
MLTMNRSAAKFNLTSSRRFILLPEETAAGVPHGPRVRRYSLTSIARTAGIQGAGRADGDAASAGVRGIGRPGHM